MVSFLELIPVYKVGRVGVEPTRGVTSEDFKFIEEVSIPQIMIYCICCVQIWGSKVSIVSVPSGISGKSAPDLHPIGELHHLKNKACISQALQLPYTR